MATPRDVLDLPAPEGPSTATTSPDPRSVSLSWSLPRLAEVFTRAMLPGRESVPVRVTDRLGTVASTDLRQQVVDVGLDGRLADHQVPGAMSVAYLKSWGYFAGCIGAAMLIADAA